MAQVIVRNIDDAAMRRLKRRAAQEGTPLESKLRALIVREAKTDRAAFRERARALRQELAGRKRSDSTRLIREDRDR
jgi:plasmid stability protein